MRPRGPSAAAVLVRGDEDPFARCDRNRLLTRFPPNCEGVEAVDNLLNLKDEKLSLALGAVQPYPIRPLVGAGADWECGRAHDPHSTVPA